MPKYTPAPIGASTASRHKHSRNMPTYSSGSDTRKSCRKFKIKNIIIMAIYTYTAAEATTGTAAEIEAKD